TVGTGTSVLLKAPYNADALSYFPTLISSTEDATLQSRMIGFPPETNIDPQQFAEFMTQRYGNENFVAAELAATIRDRSSMPPFLPVDVSKSLVDSIAAVYKDDSKLSEEQKIEKEELLAARLLNVPDLTPTTTLHHFENGRRVYFYYPRIQLDFAGRLLSNSNLTQFSYLGMVVKIKNDDCLKVFGECQRSQYPIRFVDFMPKL